MVTEQQNEKMLEEIEDKLKTYVIETAEVQHWVKRYVTIAKNKEEAKRHFENEGNYEEIYSDCGDTDIDITDISEDKKW
jgi:hypothetical protein